MSWNPWRDRAEQAETRVRELEHRVDHLIGLLMGPHASPTALEPLPPPPTRQELPLSIREAIQARTRPGTTARKQLVQWATESLHAGADLAEVEVRIATGDAAEYDDE